MGNWLKTVWNGLSRSRDPATGKFAAPDGWDWNKLLEELGKTQQEVLSIAASGGGHIFITDIAPQDEDNEEITDKVFIDVSGETILESCTTSTINLTLTIISSFPMCRIGSTDFELDVATDSGHYSKDVNYTIDLEATEIKISMLLPDDSIGLSYTVDLNVVAGPILLSLNFTGGYPGSQTQLKAGDTFFITGTTNTACNAARIVNFGACDAKVQTGLSGTTFVITGVIANRGTSIQNLAAKVQARNAAGAYGPIRLTNVGSVDGYDLVKLCNLYPSFIDNGYSNDDNPGAEAFKSTEVGDQDTEVADYNTILYVSPHGDFTIASATTYDQAKGITCTNPGDYNDSEVNYRITATRTANDAVSIFNKIIEVADTAPTLTVTQATTRLQSIVQHVITVTSDQNLSGAPDLNTVVSGTWQGLAFAGSDKVWTRTLLIEHDDARGTAAWTQVTPAASNSGMNAGITGDCVIGGFESIEVIFDHNPAWNLEIISTLSQVSDVTKLVCTDNSGHVMTYQVGTGDGAYKYTIADAGGNADPTGNYLRWCDLDAIGANTTGTAHLTIEEVV